MVLLLRKLYLYFTKDPEALDYFPGREGRGGVVPTFSRGGGVQMLISIENPYTYLLFSRGRGVRTPYLPLDPRMGNAIITGQYLS